VMGAGALPGAAVSGVLIGRDSTATAL